VLKNILNILTHYDKFINKEAKSRKHPDNILKKRLIFFDEIKTVEINLKKYFM